MSTQPPRPFWMIYGAGQGAPTVRHKDSQAALDEAKRLARSSPDVDFFVLQAVAHVVKRDVEISYLPDPDFADIPF